MMRDIDAVDIATVIEECKHNLDEVRDELTNLRAGYPILMKEVDT